MLLSDFFFEYLSAQHDLNSIEGRTALVRIAQPMIAEIPDKTYSQLMQIRLADVAQVSLPMTSQQRVESNRYQQPRQQNGLRLSLVKTAVNLLIQNPELIVEVNTQSTDWKMLDDAEIEVLLLVYETIDNNPDSTFLSLMEQFKHHDLHDRLRSLIDKVLLNEDELKTELCDAIKGLNKETRQQRVSQLVKKASQQTLSNQEKEELNQLLINK